jgi:hypothetical protein
MGSSIRGGGRWKKHVGDNLRSFLSPQPGKGGYSRKDQSIGEEAMRKRGMKVCLVVTF